MTIAPSGQQFELHYNDQHAVVVEVGGGLRDYTVGDTPILDGYRMNEMAAGARGQVLAPWPNRLDAGAYPFDHHHHELPLSEPARHNAIHGLVRWSSWRAIEVDAATVIMSHLLHPQPGYPFVLDVRITYALIDRGLHVTTTATNAGDRTLPLGLGFHPYVAAPPEADTHRLHVPATQLLETNDRGIPTGHRLVQEVPELDFRTPAPIGERHLDHCFTELARDADGRAHVSLDRVDVWMGPAFSHVMVFIPPDRSGVAIEPMTCAPDAFNNGEGLVVLGPGETLTTDWGISVP